MKIEILQGDITKIEVDAIVNAANSSLLGGGGVDGAIHRAAGPLLLDDCRNIRAKQGKCKTGQAVITIAGNLKAKHVIHTVGPVWNEGGKKKEEQLASCYSNSILLAVENECKSIAFPCISTGIYRFPKDLAAKIAIHTIRGFSKSQELEVIKIVCFDEESFQLYAQLLKD